MNMNIAQFDYLIKQIFTEFTYMPKLAQVLELKSKILYELKIDNQKQVEKEECKKCKSTGVIRYIRTKDNIQYEYYDFDTEKRGIVELNVARCLGGDRGLAEILWLPQFITFANLERC